MPDKKFIDEKHKFRTTPLCYCPWLADQLCNLINSEWKRSYNARLRTFNTKDEHFPLNLVLLSDNDEVIGHCKLSLFRLGAFNNNDGLSEPAGFIQSVIIKKEYRGQGLGKHLMREAETYLNQRKINIVYLTTEDQQGFYKALGYTECEPVDIFSNSTILDEDRKDIDDHKPAEQKKNQESSTFRAPPPPPPLPPPTVQNISANFYKGTKIFMMKKL